MKEWMISQGWPLYVMLGMTVFGMIGSILSRIFYGKLAKEAQLCGHIGLSDAALYPAEIQQLL